MARQVKLPTVEIGEVELLLIDQDEDGKWEPEWEPLRETVFGDQFSVVSRDVVNHALYRYSRPLADALGVPPWGALKKIPKVSRECYRRKSCPLYDKRLCYTDSANMPWCFEPDGVEPETVRLTATKAIELWRDRVYLVVIHE